MSLMHINELPLLYSLLCQAEIANSSTSGSKESVSKISCDSLCSFEAPSVSPFLSVCSSAQDESNHEQSTLTVEISIPQTAVPTSDIDSKLAPASWTGISDQNASCPTTLPAADRVEFTDTTVCKTYSWEITWRTPM